MGLGGISVWQLVIILIVFLVTLVAAVPFRQTISKKDEGHAKGTERREEGGPGETS